MRRCVSVLVAVAAMLGMTAGSASAAHRKAPFGFFGVVVDPQVPQYLSPSGLDSQVALMARSGVESVRTNFYWSAIEPIQGQYDWSSSDELVGTTARHGIQLLPIIEYTPGWASSNPGNNGALYAPSKPSMIAPFLTQLVKRYGPGGSFWKSPAMRGVRPVPISAWQIWNEPEGAWDWLSTPWAKTYMRLLRAAYKAIHKANRHAKVISASLVGAFNRTPWSEARSLYKLGLKRYSDVIAVNAYSGSPNSYDSVFRVLKIIGFVRNVMNGHGDRRKPIWVTEVTWSSALGKIPPRDYIDIETTPQGQAKRLSIFYKYAVTHPSGIQRAFWYTWASVYGQFPHFGVQPTFQWTGFIKWKPSQPFTPVPLLKAYARVAAKYEGCHKTSNARRCVGH